MFLLAVLLGFMGWKQERTLNVVAAVFLAFVLLL
jgi:hypothetical protein